MKKITLLTYLFLFLGIIAGRAQIIATYAGNGTAGYSGDGSAATSAEIYSPTGVACDAFGNIYIADSHSNVIRKVSTSGVISTYAGNGTAGYSGDGSAATSAELNNPHGICIDDSGNLYIADISNNRIRKVNTAGIITTIAGNGTAGYSGDGGAATSAKLNSPYSMIVDHSGNVYIADNANNRIRKINTSGIISTIAGNGTAGYSGDGGAAISAEIHSPNDVGLDDTGNIYITDVMNERIRKINTSGVISTVTGNGTAGYSGDGGAATSAELNTPSCVKVDAKGNIYIDDAGNNRIRKINTSGIISTFAGNGTAGYSGDGGVATSAEIHTPAMLIFDPLGNVYFADNANHRVRIIYLPLSISANIMTNVICYSGNTGSIFASPSGGTTPYTYLWSNSVTNDTNAGLTIGTYSVTVTDHYGVTATASATITQPAALSVSASITSNVSCNAENNGSASATPSGGMSPYTYYWSNADTGATISGLSAGTYWVTLLANNGCLDTVSASVTITQPMALRDSIVSSTNTCPKNNSGAATVGVKYGTSPYTYSWIPGGQTTATVSGLSAGYYTVVITDHHSCSDSLPVTINNISATTITARPGIICPSTNDTLNASTATSYVWSTGATTSRIIVSPSTTTTYTLESVNSGCHDTIQYSVLTDCGNSCSNAFLLPTGAPYMTDSLAANASKWYSFVDTASSFPIIVKSLTGSVGNIHKIVLYGSCGGSIIAQDSGSSDSLGIMASSLTIGNIYYILVDNSVPGCPSCSNKTEYIISLNGSALSTPLQIIYNYSGCGLNYTYSSTALHGRTTNAYPSCNTSPDVMTAVPYNSSWGTFTISSIPPGSKPIEGILIYSVIDPLSSSLPTTYQFKSNNATTYTLTSTKLGSENTQGPTCWHSPFNANSSATYSFQTIIPASDINGNGNGTYQIIPGTLPYYPTVTSNEDIDGATLIIIYSDPSAGYIGTLQINAGLIWGNDDATTPVTTTDYPLDLSTSVPAGVVNQNSFLIVDDIEDCANDFGYIDNTHFQFNSSSGPASVYNAQLWNTIEAPTSYITGTRREGVGISENLYDGGGGDCYDIVALGAYYQVSNPYAPLIASSPSVVTCPGSAVNLQLTNPEPGYSYTWSNGETGTTTYVYPTNCGQTYTVTATDGACSSTATYTADVFAIQITPSASPVCAGMIGTVTKTIGKEILTSQDYELSFTANTLCNNCNGTVTYSFSTSLSDVYVTTYTTNGGATLWVDIPQTDFYDLEGFNVTVTATCGDLYCTTSYYEPGCCGPNEGSTCAWVNGDFNNPTPLFAATSHLTSSSGNYTLQNIGTIPSSGDCNTLTIDGTLNVDHNLTIENCIILMGSRAKIVLSNGANLTIENSYLSPCSSMWDGIYVPYGSALTIENGSLIEGALNAIVSDGGSDFTIENSTLNANYIGIIVNPVSWADGGPSIIGSQISCNNYASNTPPNNSGNNVTLGTATTLDAPYTNWESEIGVELNNVYSINIGNAASSGDNNTFENLYYGIYSRASSIDIYNNTFENMAACVGCGNPTPIIPPSSGVAAFGDPTGSYTVNVGGASTYQPNTFSFSENGIWEEDTLNLNVIQNTFTSVVNGMYFEHNFKNTIKVTSNSITNSSVPSGTWGITGLDNQECSVPIETNTVTCTNGDKSYGIELEEGVLNTQTRYTVKDNDIYAAEFGIYAIGFKGGLIEGNNITTNTYLSSGSNEGIELAWGVGTNVSFNTITGTLSPIGDGIRLDDTYGTTSSLTVTCNNTYVSYYGLYFAGPQLKDYIDLNNMYTYKNGLYLYSNANIPIQGSVAHGTNNQWHDAYWLLGAPWSTYSASSIAYPNGNAFNVTASTLGTMGYPKNNGGTYPVTFIPNAGTDCYTCTEGSICAMTQCNTCVIRFATAIIKSDNPYTMYSTASHWLEKFELYSSVLANDTDYIDSTTMRLDTVVHLFIDSVTSTNMGYIYNLLNALTDTNGVSMADLTTANTMLSSISSPDTVESTFKQVYQVYADMLSNGLSIPSSTEISTLQGIAPLCPAQYGPAVYAARAMLAPIDTTLYVNTCELLPDSTSRDFLKSPTHVDSVKNYTFNLYPNPNNGNFTIAYNVGNATGCKVALYDALGEVAGEYTLSNSAGTMNISNPMLANGVYVWKIYSGKQVLKYGKVIIMK